MIVDDVPIPFELFCQKYKWPGRSALQGYRQKAKEKGLEKAFVKFGRRVLIKPKTFFELIEQQQDKQ